MLGANDAYEAFNQSTRAWARATGRNLLSAAPRDSGELAGSLKLKSFTNRTTLAIEAIRFTLARHGILLQMGVGRYRGIGTPAAAAAAQPWIENTLTPSVQALTTIIDKYYGDGTAKAITAGLPAGIDFKAK